MSDHSQPHRPHSVRLEPIETTLRRDSIQARLHEGNRRGRLPEVHWTDDSTFRVALPSHPVVTDLVGSVEEGANGSTSRVTFDLEVHRRPIWWIATANVACMAIGPWSTELFINIYSWYWQPPLCLLAALWVVWRWPRQSLADAGSLAPKWLAEIRSRLEVEPASTVRST